MGLEDPTSVELDPNSSSHPGLDPGSTSNSKPKSIWFDKKHIITYVIVVVGLAMIGGAIYAYQKSIRPTVNCDAKTYKCGEIKNDDTSSWKTYTNSQYGFEFKYPSNYTVKNNTGNGRDPVIDFAITNDSTPQSDIADVYITMNSKDQTLEDYYKQYISSWLKDTSANGRKYNDLTAHIKINGFNAIDSTFADPSTSDFREVFIVGSDKFAVFSYDRANLGRQSSATVDQILSTFKFTTDPTSIEWTKYAYPDLGFEMSIPKNSTIEKHGSSFDFYQGKNSNLSDHFGSVNFLTEKATPCASNKIQNGWKIASTDDQFCAQNGVYSIYINLNKNNWPELTSYMLKSIKLSQLKLPQPKYYLVCSDAEGQDCDMYSNGKTFIPNFTGQDSTHPLMPSLGIYTGYGIVGWDDSRIVVGGGSGDACFYTSAIFEIPLTTMKPNKLAEVSVGCEDDNNIALQKQNAFDQKKSAIEKSLTLYPGIKL